MGQVSSSGTHALLTLLLKYFMSATKLVFLFQVFVNLLRMQLIFELYPCVHAFRIMIHGEGGGGGGEEGGRRKGSEEGRCQK